MDPITTLRSMSPTTIDEPDYDAARTVLRHRIEKESARTEPTSRARRVGLGGIGIVLAASVSAIAIVVASGTLSPVDPKPASAAELLTQAADGVAISAQEFVAGPGQYLKLGMEQTDFFILDPTAASDGSVFPFETHIDRSGRTAALAVGASADYYYPSDTSKPYVLEHGEKTVTAYGDEQAAKAAYDLDRDSGRYPAPQPKTESYPYTDETKANGFVMADKRIVPYDEPPTDPQELLDWWGAESVRAWEDEKAFLADAPPEVAATADLPAAAPSAAMAIAESLAGGNLTVEAPAPFRENLLRALAFAPDVSLAGRDGDLAQFDVNDGDTTVRLTIDTVIGTVERVDVYTHRASIMADGALGQGVPDLSMEFTQEVVDRAPKVDPENAHTPPPSGDGETG